MRFSSSFAACASDCAASDFSARCICCAAAFQEIADLAILPGWIDRFRHFLHQLLELFGGEIRGLQLFDHFLERRLGGIGLSVLKLLGKVFAGLLSLHLQLGQGFGHGLNLLELDFRRGQVAEHLVGLAGGQRGDGLVQAWQRKPKVVRLLRQVRERLLQLLAGRVARR